MVLRKCDISTFQDSDDQRPKDPDMVWSKEYLSCLFILSMQHLLIEADSGSHFDSRTSVGSKKDRVGKLLPVFQVVRFPNDPCEVAGGVKNGTCYTEEECNNLGGTNGASCASGFGVCCIITLGCGDTSNQNCTYFEITAGVAGACGARICPLSNEICSIRLDFLTFVIAGPTTISLTDILLLNGNAVDDGATDEVAHSQTGRCLTDKFTISNQRGLPEICGTNTGYHVYFDASSACNSLDFLMGAQSNGAASIATRTWNIKVSQIPCTDKNLPPSGCDQFYMGTEGLFESFNFAGDRHLANQHQNICFRKEEGYCQICFNADNDADFSVGAMLTDAAAKAVVKGSLCCAYGPTGKNKGTAGSQDCIMIPGASKKTNNGAPLPNSHCGAGKGIATATNGANASVCSKSNPFRLDFYADGFEAAQAAKGEATIKTDFQQGFKLRWQQQTC